MGDKSHSRLTLHSHEEEEDEGEETEEDELEGEVEEGQYSFIENKSDKEEEDSEYSYDEEEEDEAESAALSYMSKVISEISFVWEDEVYRFEELRDPGSIETVSKNIPKRADYFDESGTEQYITVCNSLYIFPMTKLLRSLKTDEIDLTFRNVDENNVRAMCAALEVNNLVSRLLLRYNRLTPTECSYIGYVLLYNEKISLLDLTGCRIGPEGLALLIAFLGKNVSLKDLILSKCNIQDEGMKALALAVTKNNSIKTLDLSHNNLGEDSGEPLALVLKINSSITDLDLHYNNLFDPVAMKSFYMSLSNNQIISRLNLAWNGLSGIDMALLIGRVLRKNQSLAYLDLSDNRFEGMAAVELKRAVAKAKSLETLKIGKNPLSPEDLDGLLNGVKANPAVKVLDLEELWVKKSFLKILSKIIQEREFKVSYAGVFSNYEIQGPDYAAIILKRAQYEAQKPKKAKKDFGHLMWSLGNEPITQTAFMDIIKKFKAKVSKQLYPELLKQFTIQKNQLIDVVAMREKYLSLFPDSTPATSKTKKGKSVDVEGGKAKGKGKKKHAGKESVEEEIQERSELEKGEIVGDVGAVQEEVVENVEEQRPDASVQQVAVPAPEDSTRMIPEVVEDQEEEPEEEEYEETLSKSNMTVNV